MRNHLLSGAALFALLGASAGTGQTAGVAQSETSSQTNPTADSPAPARSAQASAGEGGIAIPAQDASGLGDIVVTAQRVSQNSQKAAVPISVISGADVLKAGLSRAEGLSTLAPALAVQTRGSYNFFFVRGVGNFAATSYSDPAIAFNYDGVYIGRPISAAGVFYDLDRVEILKGPQGTLYGRNATGGAINVLPTQPKLGQWAGYGSASYGNYNDLNLQGALNAPLGENGAVRVSGTVVRHDGYLRDGEADQKTEAFRIQTKSELTPNLTARVSFDYAHVAGAGDGYVYLDSYAYTPALTSLPLGQRYTATPSGLPLDGGVFTPAAQAYRQQFSAGSPRRNLDALSAFPYQHNDFFGSNAEIDWQTPIGTLTVIPAWRYAHLNNLGGTLGTVLVAEKDEQYSIEARLGKTGIGIFDYNVGLYYFDESISTHLLTSRSSLVNQQDYTTGTKSYAAFGRLTAHLTDTLRLVGGIRYTHDDKRFDGTTNSLVLVCVVPTGCPNTPLFGSYQSFADIPFKIPAYGVAVGPGPVAGTILSRSDFPNDSTQKISKPTYRGAVEFDVAPRSLLYASVETGYRSGGFSLDAGYETYQPEYITAYTIGSKNRFFDNRLQLNIEAFYWDYRNQQLSHVGIDKAGFQGNFTQNIGKTTNKGVEVEGRFLPARNTLLSADIQYLDAKYKSFTYQVPVGTAPPYTTCAVSADANPVFYDVDCSGKPAYYSPKWTINLGGQQTFELGDYRIVAGVDTQYKSSAYVGFDYRPEQLVAPYWTTNAVVSWGPSSEHWDISAFIRNIEGDRTPTYVTSAPAGPFNVAALTAPRTYGIRVSGKF